MPGVHVAWMGDLPEWVGFRPPSLRIKELLSLQLISWTCRFCVMKYRRRLSSVGGFDLILLPVSLAQRSSLV